MTRSGELSFLSTLMVLVVLGCSGDGGSEPSETGSEEGGPTVPTKDGGATEEEGACRSGTWDDDGNASTACVAWTECKAGTYVTKEPSSTTDRACTACASGSYSTSQNAPKCKPWRECGSGEKEGEAGTSTRDRTCVDLSWTRQFGTNLADDANSVTVDGNGNVYVVGVYARSPFTRKYDGTGKDLWMRSMPNEGTATSVSMVGNGDIYMVGSVNSYPFIRRYDVGGKELWAHVFGNGYSGASSVSVSGDGNVYVAGSTSGEFSGQTKGGGYDAYLRKYDGKGNDPWTRQFGLDKDEYAYGVSVDGSGNAYVVGTTQGTLPGQKSAGGSDAYIRKYDGTGKELWTRQFGADESDDDALGVRVDGNGTVYVVGSVDGALPGQKSVGSSDVYLREYDGTGKELRTRQIGTNSIDMGKSVSIDGNGTVYVVGSTYGAFPGQKNAGGRDAFVMRLAP